MRVPVTVLSAVGLVAAGVLAGVALTAGGQLSMPAQSPVLLAQAQGGQAAPAPARGQAAPAPARGQAVPAPARGQAPAAAGRGQAAAAPAIPRASDGKPDFSGIWQVLDNSTNGNVEPHSASYGVRAGQGAIIDTPDGKIPYLPAALAKRNENFKKRDQDPVAYCWKPGVPRITYVPFPFQITQTPNWIQVTYEFVHSHRNIYLNNSPHLPGIDFYNGDSRARWDGDTLVVDVRNINDDPTRPTWFDSVGNYHSDQLRVVERWTFDGPDHIVYRATMEDPKVFSRPWTIEVLLYRHKEKNYRILEYECQVFKEKLALEGKTKLVVVEDNYAGPFIGREFHPNEKK
jgi:hypothetical protein